jgi:hypothetical protein
VTHILKLPASIALVIVALGVASMGASGPAAAPRSAPLSVRQTLIPGHLALSGDRMAVSYAVDTPGVASPTGALFVRNDTMASFERIPLALKRGVLRAVVPARLIRPQKLSYYAVVRDPETGRSTSIPRAGARAPDVVLVLEKPVVVTLGAHRFGHPHAPGVVVARAGAGEVGWRLPRPGEEGTPFGPQTFVVSADRSIWLADGINARLLVWRAGRPGTIARTVPLPLYQAESDVALGQTDTYYVLRGLPPPKPRTVLERVSTSGRIWRSELAGIFSDRDGDLALNTALRIGPDARLYAVSGRPGSTGGERGWRAVATAHGRRMPVAAQRLGDFWPFQPLSGGLRLLGTVYSPRVDVSPREARFALVDRRGRVLRSWRVLSRTDINFNHSTPDLVGGDPVVVLDVTAGAGQGFKWEYLVLRLGPRGPSASLTLSHALFGDQLLADVKIGPDGRLYQLETSPTKGIAVRRYSRAPAVAG